jgi:hypothetical protein
MPTTIAERRHAALDRRAAANIGKLWGQIVNLHGKSLSVVRHLNPQAEAYPALGHFQWKSSQGAWTNLGDGSSGNGVIDLIVYLSGGCSRDVAAEFLEGLLEQLFATA